MRRTLTLVATLFLFATTAWCQETKIVTGVVTDAKDGSPLAGVTIKVKNTNKVFVSGQNGSFTASIPSDATQLTFTYIGYTEVSMPVTDKMNVQLSYSGKTLNEVVVVGYGRASKRNLTGSISKISGREVENVPAPSFESALQGKAAGVVIESGSGKLGQGIKIRIRGTSSISASSQPLYVVDGLPVNTTSQSDVNNDPTNPLIDINPNDIESVEVLKDASASAIYGARAANGVVLITTKKGRFNQKTTIELNTSLSFSNPTRTFDFLNAKEYVSLINQAGISDGQYDFANDISGYASEEDAIADYQSFYKENILDYYSLGTDYNKGEVNTNWQDLLYHKNAPARQIDLSLNGGTEKTRFFISGFYNDQDAIVINNRFRRYGARLNLENAVTDKFSVGINVSATRSQLDRVTSDNSFSTPGQLVAQLPISPLHDPETGELNGNTLYPNALFDAQFNFDRQVTYRTLGNVFGNYTILPSLSFRSEFGADILNLTEDAFEGKETIDGGGIGKANLITSQSVNFNTNNYFTFTPGLGENNKLNAVAGMSYLQNDSKNASSFGEQTPSDAIKNLTATTLITFAGSGGDRYTFLSYFLRANYSFMDKYLLSASIRSDGSSRFGPNNRYGVFPSASLGWVLSDENFLKNSKLISFLKLRGSWGLTGNAEIGESGFLGLYGVSNYPNFPGFTPTQLPNPDLKWEKTTQTDGGIEFGLLKNRISGEVDYYNKKTTDLLLSINVPNTTGYSNVFKNIGSMSNKGFEFTLNTLNFDGAFKWNTSINLGYNKNEVLDIDGQIIEGGYIVTQRAVEGQPIGVFYGQKFLGVDPATGDALYLGEDGKPTTDFDEADMVVLGKSNPDWTGGFTNNFSYKGFDLSAFFTFVSGNQVNNGGGYFMSDGFYNGFDNQTTDILNAWKKPGDITTVPRAGYFYGSGYEPSSSRWLYDGSYIRLKNLTLAYSIPKTVMQSLGISSAKIYIAGQNLLTFTKYPADPEVNVETLGNIGGGQDFYTIPQAKTITIGINVKF